MSARTRTARSISAFSQQLHTSSSPNSRERPLRSQRSTWTMRAPVDALRLDLHACDASIHGTIYDAAGGTIAKARVARLEDDGTPTAGSRRGRTGQVRAVRARRLGDGGRRCGRIRAHERRNQRVRPHVSRLFARPRSDRDGASRSRGRSRARSRRADRGCVRSRR